MNLASTAAAAAMILVVGCAAAPATARQQSIGSGRLPEPVVGACHPTTLRLDFDAKQRAFHVHAKRRDCVAEWGPEASQRLVG